ncbi:FtsX-like permease family protein [Microbacterium sp. ASV49]|uniref:FtsX-like permease family protein n=1 Tax=Microbacterium candidum TaxID=3041922 RepID=A0ABT7MTQ8_9MICO|nr:FtsX-like permease family protein [Microbacterium sp. ASV49]MDL9977835.1 FtsX-like permease family protein [Microbacterium sp. ASV49]
MRLLFKQWAAFRGAIIALAIVVLIAAFAVVAWPRAVTSLLTQDVQYRIDQPSAGITSVQTAHRVNGLATGNVAPKDQYDYVWNFYGASLEKTYRTLPQPLKSGLREPGWTARTTLIGTTGPRSEGHYGLQLEAYPQWRSQMKLVEGSWPAAYQPEFAPVPEGAGQAMPGVSLETVMRPTVKPIEVAMTAESAKAMGLSLGQTRPLDDIAFQDPTTGLPTYQQVELVGLVAPRDDAAPYWELQSQRAHPTVTDKGDAGVDIRATAWLDPAPWGEMQYSFTADLLGWYAAHPPAYTWQNLPTMTSQLNAFLSSPHEPAEGQVRMTFTTQLTDVLAGIQSGGSSLQTLLILLATGPLGAAFAVLILGSELLVERRRPVLTLLSARGASPWWIRSRMALEGLVAGIPAAIVGLVLAFLVTAGTIDAAALFGAASCAVLPAAILAVLARPSDRVPRRRRRWRWVLEVLVLLVTVAALVTLAERGVAPGGVDPLLVLTPLLVTLSVSVIMLRLYPLPLRALNGSLRKRRGAIGLIGASRSVLGIRSALIPVLVVLVGVAMAVFSAVAFQTERDGVSQAAHARVGSDISLGGPGLSTAELKQVTAVPGVTATGAVDTAGFAGVSRNGGSDFVEVLVADTAHLASLQSGLPADARVPDLSQKVDGKIPIAIGNWQDATTPGVVSLSVGTGDVDAIVVSATASLGAAAPNSAWILVDKKNLPDGLDTPSLRGALVALDGAHQSGKDAATAGSAIAKVTGAGVTMMDAAAQADAIREAPAVTGVESALMIATALGALLAVIALVLTLVMGARERIRLVGTLRTLGFDRRQTTGLVVWEVAPILATGLVGGVIAGIVLPFAVLAPLDLSAFTGGAQPPIPIDPLVITAVVAVFVVVVAAVVALAVWISSRRSPASVLRVGEEE